MEPDRAPAFYALRGGGWRDYWTLLHPPYTLWHLSYVALGAAAAPVFHLDRLGWTLLAFFLAVGVSAHALDEVKGHPLGTQIPRFVLMTLAIGGLSGAVILGVEGMARVTAWLGVFVVVGTLLVPAYNLEWFHGTLHTDLVFAIGWGAFPALVASFSQGGRLNSAGVLVAIACLLLSATQRHLSTPVRLIRRKVGLVSGRISLADGTEQEITAASLLAIPERALRLMWIAIVLLAIGSVLARVS